MNPVAPPAVANRRSSGQPAGVHLFDAVCSGGELAVSIGVGRNPAEGTGWYWAVVVGPGRACATVVDAEVVLPARPGSLEFRSPGLWADHSCLADSGQWTVGLEAFGVALDDPWLAWGRAFGQRVAVGADLDWDPVAPDGNAGGEASTRCRVHGELLVGTERIELACDGVHTHRTGGAAPPWGDAAGAQAGHLWGWWIDGDERLVEVWHQAGAPRDGAASTWVVDGSGGGVIIEVMAVAPVLVASTRVVQAVARVTPATGGGGLGWVRFVPW